MHLLHIVCKRTNSRKWFQLVLEEVLKTLGDKQHKFKFVGGDFPPSFIFICHFRKIFSRKYMPIKVLVY